MRSSLRFVGLIIVGICGILMPQIARWASEATPNNNNNNNKLRFNKNGEFKILQISDTHYANGKDTLCRDVLPFQFQYCSDLNTTDFLRRFIHTEDPDLIIFTGDNIHAIDCYNYNKSMDEIFAPAIESNIPWTAILGNHDVNTIQTGNSREAIMEYITKLNNTLSLKNPSNLKEGESIWGWGNYNLEVGGVEGSPLQDKSILNLYLLDSGEFTYSFVPPVYMGYEWIHSSQQSWFLRTSKQLQDAYMSAPYPQQGPAPGLVFFHIPIPEFNNITEPEMIGVKQEKVACPGINSGFFDTMLASGDIKATFVGHSHLNDYCGKLCDIQLCADAVFGYHGYGLAGWPRRARVINVKLEELGDGEWGPVESIVTWKRLHDDRLSVVDPQVLWTSTGDQSDSKFKSIMSE